MLIGATTSAVSSGGWRTTAGVLLVGMLLTSIASTVWSVVPAVAASVFAWGALALLWPRLGRQQRIQAVTLSSIGILALLWGVSHGAGLSLERVLGQNQPILSMLASITLLRVLNPPVKDDEPELPRGRGTYLRSMVGVHAFGAVINISAVVVMADRLARAAPLTMSQGQLLSRTFTTVACYSPFIGGVALALAYTPGSSPGLLMVFGFPLSLAAMALLAWYALTGRVDDLDNFRGYPIHLENLWLPMALAAVVLLGYGVTTGFSVLTLITMLTPVVAVVALLAQGGVPRARASFSNYVFRRLPEMGGELALFLGAGVLGAGLVAVFAAAEGWTPFTQFDAVSASLLLLAFVVTSLVCIHAVVVVSVAVPLVYTVSPDPTFLALALAMGWGLGCAVNPMSGTNLILGSRYGLNNWAIGRSNVPFSATLYVLAVGLLFLYERTVM